MGLNNGKLTSRQIRELTAITYFNKKELQKWYKDFLHDCPDGYLRKEEFKIIYRNFFPSGDPSKFAGFVFDAFDSRKAGAVTFHDFILALSVTSRGSLDEKLNWAFCLYDLDGDGYISKTDMMSIVDGIYTMIGNILDLPTDENTPEKRVDKIFKQMDVNRDGRLSRHEFQNGSMCDPWVVQALSMNLPGDLYNTKNRHGDYKKHS